MAAKTGPKPKLTGSDSARINAMIEQGCSDAQIASAFGVSRQTINRLRHSLADSQPEPENKVLSYFAAWKAWDAAKPELPEGASDEQCRAYREQRDEFMAAELKRRGF